MNATAVAVSFESVLVTQRAAFRVHPFPSARERRDHLAALEQAILKNRDAIAAALDLDFGGRCANEVLFSETYVSLNAVRHAHRHVKRWMARRPRHVDWPMQPALAWVMPQPAGVIGIISPWNYPLFLTIAPLAAALAAGNRVMIKVSEFTPATSDCIQRFIASTFAHDHVAVITGDAAAGREFSALSLDHLLFTGSTAVGREVMRAAAENLTPVTLELGGKSPAILAPDADVDSAASDIVYGKFLNAGQTCIAPDYVLLAANQLDEFVDSVQQHVSHYWHDAARNPDYTAVINRHHIDRLRAMVDEARDRGAQVMTIGPQAEPGSRRMPPTLILNPPDDIALMREEIFGPLLPIRTYASLDAAIEYVNDHERPLALYLFTRSDRCMKDVLKRTVSGSACVNDTLVYIAVEDLPFGGTGASGFGHYHGQEGFDTFSKLKPVFYRRWPGLSRSLRPPYGWMHRLMERVLISRR